MNSMKLETAALILSKIGNPTRLKIVRMLVRAGDQGLPVGTIQKKLNIPGFDTYAPYFLI